MPREEYVLAKHPDIARACGATPALDCPPPERAAIVARRERDDGAGGGRARAPGERRRVV